AFGDVKSFERKLRATRLNAEVEAFSHRSREAELRVRTPVPATFGGRMAEIFKEAKRHWSQWDGTGIRRRACGRMVFTAMPDQLGNLDHDSGPIELRVFFAQGLRSFRLRDGLTIGATIACDICIDHPDVLPRHAHITRGAGHWLVECTSSGRLHTLD